MGWIYHTVHSYLLSWGYWAVLIALLGEDAGLPLPGETVLMFASFLAHKTGQLKIEWVILVGIVAAVMGDNLGFLVGRHFGKTLILWMKKIFRLNDTDVAAAKDQIRRHGGRTIFFARFIFGLRTVAGPIAGSLDMEWKRFFKFNLAGGATWVTAMAFVGYAFANEFQSLLGYIEKASWAIAAGLFLFGYIVWRKQKKHFEERQANSKKPGTEAA